MKCVLLRVMDVGGDEKHRLSVDPIVFSPSPHLHSVKEARPTDYFDRARHRLAT